MKNLKSLLFTLCFVASFSANAGIIEVTSNADSGPNTLRQSISNATSGDTVLVNISDVITLNDPIQMSGENEIWIIGPYPAHLTIQPNSGGFSGAQLFELDNCENIHFEKLGFLSSGLPDPRAFSITNSGGYTFIDECVIENFQSTMDGGAIFMSDGFLDISRSTIIDCSAETGGAIFCDNGDLKATNCSFIGNIANDRGGALLIQGFQSAVLNHCTFDSNQSTNPGTQIHLPFNVSGFLGVVLQNCAAQTFGTLEQFTDPAGAFNSNGGNKVDLGGGADITVPWAAQLQPGDQHGVGMTLGLNPYKTDGFGLKYMTIIDSNSVLVDGGVSAGNALQFDCRRAPRRMSGFAPCCGPNPSPIPDAGAVEYSKLIVDNDSGDESVQYSLPWALNMNYDFFNYIEFTSAVANIQPLQNMAETLEPTYIDGYSKVNTVIPGPPPAGGLGVTPSFGLIEINNGSGLPIGIMFAGPVGGSIVSGLRIMNFGNFGISTNAPNLKVHGCEIGLTDGDGSAPNQIAGIELRSVSAQIGGRQHWTRNVIGGNGSIAENANIVMSASSADNLILGNFIGVSANGLNGIGGAVPSSNGIFNYGTANKIGAGGKLAKNIISGNPANGIVEDASTNTVIVNNIIGLEYNGTYDIQNSNGIRVQSSAVGTQIGGYQLNLTRNIITANTNCNILYLGGINSKIVGNYIGVDITGENMVLSTVVGVHLNGGGNSSVLIGDFLPNSKNVISGNQDGIRVQSSGPGCQILGNYIGTNWNGTLAIGNGGYGINVMTLAGPTTIGFAAAGNLISGHTGIGASGIRIQGGSNHTIQGNIIGLTAGGVGPLGNHQGIDLDGTATCQIGGDQLVGEGNVIADNATNGIDVYNSCSNVTIYGNFIGTNALGSAPFGNGLNGIKVDNCDGTIIGGPAPFGNLISDQSAIGGTGIFCDGIGFTTIEGNIIGTNLATTTPYGNETGIRVAGTHGAVIGGSSGNENYICGSTIAGIYTLSSNVDINGNFIGLGISTSNASMGNTQGILIEAPFVQVGNLGPGFNNYIANSGDNGIFINGNGADVVEISHCRIGIDLASLPAPTVNNGILISEADSCEIGFIAGNDIVASGNAGISIVGDAHHNTARFNVIGDLSGTALMENAVGVELGIGSHDNTIGGAPNTQGNMIVNSLAEGILMTNSGFNTVVGNFIGLDPGNFPAPNNVGIRLVNSDFNLIGGSNIGGSQSNNVISHNTDAGVIIDNSNDNWVFGNFIGMDPTGFVAAPNVDGVRIENQSENNVIGDPAGMPQFKNVISGNSNAGIMIDDADSNFVAFNELGSDFTGVALGAQPFGVLIGNGATENAIGGDVITQGNNVLGNTVAGIVIDQSPSNRVEGNIVGANSAQAVGISIQGGASQLNAIGAIPPMQFGNRIIDNQLYGIEFSQGAHDNTVTGNFVGLDPLTNAASIFSLQPIGIHLAADAGANNLLGDNVPGGGNVISGNDYGILNDGANNNAVFNNFIGTDTAGMQKVPNLTAGVALYGGSSGNLIGGGNPNESNLISGNLNGIEISDPGSTFNDIDGNLIGLNVNLSDSIPNETGILITNGADNNNIGLPPPGAGNIISGNYLGIDIDASDITFVRNNLIGPGPHGNTHGVAIQNGSALTIIGGPNPGDLNVISGNDSVGVGVIDAAVNTITGNYIGVAADGTTPSPNSVGVYIENSDLIEIGKNTVEERNIISSNSQFGIILVTSNDCEIKNNFIGTDNTGNVSSPSLANGVGIFLNSSNTNEIGGDSGANEGNVVSGNLSEGINLVASSDNSITGNKVGLSEDNNTYLGNGGIGIALELGSDGNDIGLAGAGFRNVITANFEGIHCKNSSSNYITNNYVGNDHLGGLATGIGGTNNQQYGIGLDTGCVDNHIVGLNVISGNELAGVVLYGIGNFDNEVANNRIGVDVNGINAYNNDSVNVYIAGGAKHNLIGGSTLADKNIIGGDPVIQVYIEGAQTDSNEVYGNNIGVGVNNTATYSSLYGVAIGDQAFFNVIGGGNGGEGNNIACGDSAAVFIHNSNQTRIFGNRIGILPNDSPANVIGSGVVLAGADNTHIGGLALTVGSDSSNIIANCGGAGVDLITIPLINSSYGNLIIGNSIFNNGELGIDIDGDDQIEPIDTNQTLGNNGDIDIPVIVDAWTCGDGNTHVGFKFFSNNALGTYHVEFYTNTVPDGSNYGEGQVYLGDFDFMPGTPHDTIYIDLGQPLTTNTYLTATVTGTLNNTSEFSENYQVTDPPTYTTQTLEESCLMAGDGQILIDAPGANYFSIDGFTNWTYQPDGDTLTVLPGVYTVEAQYLNGCSVSQLVTVDPGQPLPFTDIVVDDTCGMMLGQVVIDTTITNSSGGSGNYSFSFDGGMNFGPANGIAAQTASSWSLFLIDNTTGCISDTIPATINNITDVVDESFTFADLCPGVNGFPANIATGGGTWAIDPPPVDLAFVNTTTGELQNTTVGEVYSIVYTVGQCNEKDTVLVTINPNDDDGFSYPNYCLGSIPTITTNTPGGTWTLLGGPGTIDPSSGIIGGAAGTYSVNYLTNGACPNDSTATVIVYDKAAAPVIQANQTVYCPGEVLDSLTSTTTGAFTYEWYSDATLSTLIGTGIPFTPASINTGLNWFYLVTVDANTCVSDADSVVYEGVDVSNMYAGPDQQVCIGSVVQLEAFGGDSYLWNASTQLLDDTSLEDPTARILVGEEFVVTITHAQGCEVVDTIDVTLIPQDQCSVDSYNAFSPNNDGRNDFWIIDGIEGFPENTVVIYNRWGDVLNEFENYNNVDPVWDGRNKNGRALPSGTYFYVIDVNGAQTQAGWVQIVK